MENYLNFGVVNAILKNRCASAKRILKVIYNYTSIFHELIAYKVEAIQEITLDFRADSLRSS
jgi:hypothetical protein